MLGEQIPSGYFSQPTCYKIGIQLIERLRIMHENNYIHNDIKEDNMVIGHEDPNDIFLIDYNISKRYKDEKGKHVEK